MSRPRLLFWWLHQKTLTLACIRTFTNRFDSNLVWQNILLILVLLSLALMQGYSSTGKHILLNQLSHKVLNRSGTVLVCCWDSLCNKPHAQFISSVQHSRERELYFCDFVCKRTTNKQTKTRTSRTLACVLRHLPSAFFQTWYACRN